MHYFLLLLLWAASVIGLAMPQTVKAKLDPQVGSIAARSLDQDQCSSFSWQDCVSHVGCSYLLGACTSKNYDTSGRNSSNADNKTTCTFSLADPQKLALSSVVSSAGSSVCNYKFEFNSAVPLTIELADGDFVVTLFDASGKTMGKMDRSLSKCSADTGLLQSVVVNGVSKAVVATGVSQISLTVLAERHLDHYGGRQPSPPPPPPPKYSSSSYSSSSSSSKGSSDCSLDAGTIVIIVFSIIGGLLLIAFVVIISIFVAVKTSNKVSNNSSRNFNSPRPSYSWHCNCGSNQDKKSTTIIVVKRGCNHCSNTKFS